ncbi:MAG TPA: phosphate ABC transporter substrate-binding protein [Anaerolinea thermolimosa]|uniref:Phosphate-binding protein n=1 Tax=Anaerolinea thermolimosa TaxID=229919 RepID=A0A3D1JEF9_9CHLR|nr:phosphate ABC transporter substrate-binding protein [Anaerolinea thermolimosa]GAP05599.1 phosphate ABC transporter substrate-binding protein, PhoT family [Anaerolinea thermolimosa]HCE16824.1 phosphate ABC transporter substrate-binding protein [Anaerolinea thermolimosa]
MKPFLRFMFAVILILLGGCASGSSISSAPAAQPTRVAAYIQNKGSDTIVNLALAWAERYQELHPDVRISVTGGGSGTGIAAMIDGTVDIANASRAMKAEEIAAAKAKGIEPVEHVVARDAIAVIVNPANPVEQLTLEQISLIYQGAINNWKEVGGEDRPIVRLSRETNSGTHVYFLEEVLRLGQKENKALFSMDTLLLPSSEGIISEVMDNPNAIGYDGLGYVIPEVKVVAVARRAGEAYIKPSVETVNNGEYPISRDLYMYTRRDAGQAVLDYLGWIKSSEAQKIVLKLGFVPIVGQSVTRK